MRQVTAKEAHDACIQNADHVIVDVRELGESFGSAIPGAIALPLTRFLKDWVTIKDHPHVYLICASGGRSSMAADYLASQGHPDVANIAGGVLAWEAEGLPFAD